MLHLRHGERKGKPKCYYQTMTSALKRRQILKDSARTEGRHAVTRELSQAMRGDMVGAGVETGRDSERQR